MRLVGALVVLVALAIGFLHTSWGKEMVRARVEAALADGVDGSVTLASVDYGFLFDGVDLGGLAIRDRDGKPAVSVGALHVDLDRGSLLGAAPVIERIDISGLAVAIVQGADGRSNLDRLAKPSNRAPLAALKIAALAIHGSASFTQLDGTAIQLHDLVISGSVDAHPAAGALDAQLAHVTAAVAITRPAGPTTNADLAIESIVVSRRADAAGLDVRGLVLGALSVESIHGQLALAGSHLVGAQALAITGARVDHRKLATELGRELMVDDARVDASASGPPAALVIHGGVAMRGTTLTLDGTLDLSAPARPGYHLVLAGRGASSDVLPAGQTAELPAIATDIRVAVDGAGVTLADLDAEIGLTIGHTQVGALAIDDVSARAHAQRGAYTLEALTAHGLAFEVTATGDLASDTTLHGRLAFAGNPAQAMTVLRQAGIEIPRRMPRIDRLAVAITAAGKLDGAIDVALEPTRIALAGGSVAMTGTARVDHHVLADATTKVVLRGLDLRQLAALAGKPPPPVEGSLSGSVALVRTEHSRRMTYDVAVALREPAISIVAHGGTDGATGTARAQIVRSADHAVLGTLTADVPIDERGLVPARGWHVVVDLVRRPLAELAAFVPAPMRARIPAGDVAVRAELSGSPSKPRGTVDVSLASTVPELGDVHADLHADVAPAARGGGVTVTTRGEVGGGVVAQLAGTLELPALFTGRTLDAARVRAGAVLAETITLPDRALASLPRVPPALAALGGQVGGVIELRGTPPALAVDAKLAWHGYPLAAGGEGTTRIAIAGTAEHVTATIEHAGALAVTADVTRAGEQVAITAHVTAADTPLLGLLPALPMFSVPGADLGRLRSDLGATLALTGKVVDRASFTGSLAITRGAFALPHTNRSWHDLGVELAGDPAGLRIVTLDAHEGAARALHAAGTITLDRLKPQAVHLALAAHDWLVLGARSPLLSDAPAATVDLDARVDADLTAPILAVDATVDHLDLRAPDRRDRAHQAEVSSVAGDIIFVDGPAAIGKLPVAPPAAPPPALPPIDARIHIPGPIHALKAPLDVTARGELTVTVRDGVPATRGELTILSGTLTTFGNPHDLVEGRVRFTAEHPHGELDLVFARHLPDFANRDLAGAARGERIHLTGEPAKPTVGLSGIANDTLPEVFSMYYAGRPQFVAPPGLPASATVEVPRGDQLNVLAYLSLVIPHLLFLDRVSAWADPSEPRGAYGRIRNVELDRYTAGERTRVRAVARPTTPGRSTAELQWDQIWFHDDHALFGGGLRAGDRLGGGVGVFFEWSSAE